MTSQSSLRRLGIVSLGLLLSACSTRYATYAPDGRRAFVVSCSGYLSSWSECLAKAGQACGSRGYDKLEGGEDDRRLLVACKTP